MGITGQVATSGQPLRLSVQAADEMRVRIAPEYVEYLDKVGLSSLLSVPLRAQGKVIGVLTVSRERPGRPYTEEDELFLQTVADRAGLAVHNARLYDDLKQAEEGLQRQAKRAETLSAISRSFAECGFDDRAVLDRATGALVAAVGDFCIIRLLSPDGQWLDCARGGSLRQSPDAVPARRDRSLSPARRRGSERRGDPHRPGRVRPRVAGGRRAAPHEVRVPGDPEPDADPQPHSCTPPGPRQADRRAQHVARHARPSIHPRRPAARRGSGRPRRAGHRERAVLRGSGAGGAPRRVRLPRSLTPLLTPAWTAR